MLVEGIGVNSSDKSLGNSVSLLRSRDGSLALTRNDFNFLLDLYANSGGGMVLFLKHSHTRTQ